MRFEEQYPNIERYHSLTTIIRRRREVLRKDAIRRKKASEERKKEFIGMAILVPSVLVMLFVLYVLSWSIVPSAWW